MQAPDELRAVFEEHLASIRFHPDLGELEEAMRYATAGGGKRIRPVVCLATAEAAGGTVREALDAAVALELVHTFSLVHDDLPAMDDDDERRGRPSTHVAFGEAVGLLAGDALLTEAIRIALVYPSGAVATELVDATIGMIGGQYLDITDQDVDLTVLHHLKTGRLFAAAVGLGLATAQIPVEHQAPWRVFGAELGLLFQAVDDVLDGDGFAARDGIEAARTVAAEAAARAKAGLGTAEGDTSVLEQIVDELLYRTT